MSQTAAAVLAATAFEWAQLSAAGFAVVAAIAVPATAYFRRPSVRLEEDGERTYSRLEGIDQDVPFVRLLVRAGRFRRAAHGARVEVVGVRRQGETTLVPLGHWPLGWTSADRPDVTVYASDRRPVDLGALVFDDPDRAPILYVGGEPGDVDLPATFPRWHLTLALYGGAAPADGRHRLPPGEWAIRLVVGTADGNARSYDVHVSWQGDEPDAESALAAVLDRLAVVAA